MKDYQNKLVKDLDPQEKAYLWYDILAEYQKTQEAKPAFLPVILRVEHLAGQVEALKSEVVSLDQLLDMQAIRMEVREDSATYTAKALHQDKERIDMLEKQIKALGQVIGSLNERVKELEEMHYHAHRHPKKNT